MWKLFRVLWIFKLIKQIWHRGPNKGFENSLCWMLQNWHPVFDTLKINKIIIEKIVYNSIGVSLNLLFCAQFLGSVIVTFK